MREPRESQEVGRENRDADARRRRKVQAEIEKQIGQRREAWKGVAMAKVKVQKRKRREERGVVAWTNQRKAEEGRRKAVKSMEAGREKQGTATE